MSVSDPANVFTLPLAQDPSRDPFVRPRSRGALLVTIDGTVIMIAERRGAKIVVRPGTPDSAVTAAAKALVPRLLAQTSRDLTVETIDGQPASGSKRLQAFQNAGFKRGTTGLRFYRSPP